MAATARGRTALFPQDRIARREPEAPDKDALMRNRSRLTRPTTHHSLRLRRAIADASDPALAPTDHRAADRTFLARWLDDLDPLLRTWLLASVEREVRDRAAAELLNGIEREAEAIDLLVGACAEAHDLTGRELRSLIPTIEAECRMLLRGESPCSGRRNGFSE
jgi:hypothetical protein